MKNYSYTALSLLVCATATGCFSERVKAIEEGVTEDAGDGTRSEKSSNTTEEDLTDAGPTGSTTAEPSTPTKPKPTKPKPDPGDDSDGTDTTSAPTDTSDPDPSATTADPTTTTAEPTSETPTEEDEFFHPTPASEDTTEAHEPGGDPGGGWADAGAPGGSETTDWGDETTSASTNTGGAGDTSDDSDDGAGEPQGDNDNGAQDPGQTPDQIIEEADVIRRDGDTLYALSFSAGLAVVDVSDPANLELLGRIEFEQTAIEMYLDGSEVVVLFQGGRSDYYYYDDWYGYASETTIGVYDVSNPAQISEIDSETLSGSLLDSRKVGDRLYVAANGDCYSCEDGGPSVGSFNLAGSGIAFITSVDIPVASDGSYSPTLYVTNERLYLAQENWGYVDAQGNPVPWDVVYGSTDSTSSEVTWAQSAGATGAATSVDAPTEAVDAGAAVVDAAANESEPVVAVDGGTTMGDTSGSGGYAYANWTVLQVVDISDDSGAMTLGASVRIDGSVRSRWQMDEHEGVLRVVSQDGWAGPAPVVEMFTVEDSETITKVGHLEIELPRPETLQSVRFDGDRGYVVTFEQVDPLFTLDLSDPAAPKQVGELEIPGFLYHMLPKGDRLYAVGYDDSNDDSLHASVFDVSDLANPVMLKRVNFGGQWGWFGEDQDDIEKSVQMLDQQGLMLIPFSGYDYSEDSYCGYLHSGIQLIDYSEDDLTLRGVTDAVGYARRAFYHRDHLFGYSDRALQTFDISDRDNPVAVDALAFAHSIERVVVVGDKLVRIGDDGFENTFIDVVPVETPNAPIQNSALTMDDLSSCNYVSYFKPIARDGIVYLPRQVYDHVDYTANLSLLAVDVRNPSVPTKLAEVALAQDAFDLEDIRVLETQNALVVSQRQVSYEWVEVEGGGDGDSTADSAVSMDAYYDDYYEDYYGYYDTVRKLRLDVVDTREVGATLSVASVDIDQDWLDNGFASSSDQINMTSDNGSQHSLVAGGNLVVSQHKVYEPDGSGYRYFAERLDVSDPAQPVWLAAVNVPGQALALLNDDVHLVTADSVTVPLEEADCSQSEYDDYIVCYNRMIELSALTLEEQRAVRHAKVRLGSNNNAYSVAWDAEAVYVQRNDYDSNDDDVLAYAYDLQPLGELSAYPGSLTDWYGVPVLVGHSNGAPSAALISTESGELKETARAAHVGCDPAVVGSTAVYCADGFDGIDVTPLE